MSKDSKKNAPRDENWKPKKKVTMGYKKNDDDDWESNDEMTMYFEETTKEDESDDSQ